MKYKNQLSFHDNTWTVTNGLYHATGFILILQGGKGKGRQKDSYLKKILGTGVVAKATAPLAISRC